MTPSVYIYTMNVRHDNVAFSFFTQHHVDIRGT